MSFALFSSTHPNHLRLPCSDAFLPLPSYFSQNRSAVAISQNEFKDGDRQYRGKGQLSVLFWSIFSAIFLLGIAIKITQKNRKFGTILIPPRLHSQIHLNECFVHIYSQKVIMSFALFAPNSNAS
jgi:hypothetical protein